jgi:hypothetical protein
VTYVIVAWGVLVAALLLGYRRRLLGCWREPVLREPVLILESDDWGAGPTEQAGALRRLAELLGGVHDAAGRPAVMTLGVVLADIDRAVWRRNGTYAARTLAADERGAILQAMRDGIAAGVFAPQLHGMEHYWPAALLRRAAVDERVRAWLADEAATTEALPDELQSRWVDAATLPSTPLPAQRIRAAVAEEAGLFAGLFGASPSVAVPNTFVWNDDVERAWAECGVRHVITPGSRYEGRAADGTLVASRRAIANGDAGTDGLRYLVRDVYFEPARGHRAEAVVAEAARRFAFGRPALIETHRFNYLGNAADDSLAALGELLRMATARFPRLRFIRAEALGDALSRQDPQWIEPRASARFPVWIRRVLALPRFGKLARLSGLAMILRGVGALVSRATSDPLPLDGGGLGRG